MQKVIDIWENEEILNNFIQKLMPVTDKLIDTKPKVEIYPLYVLFIQDWNK